jgi:membrane associated rhomboid family serine protease
MGCRPDASALFEHVVQIDPSLSPATERIPTRTRQRAMDWSLVLASQGIEAIILNDPDGGWQLNVSATEADRARVAIGLYRRENRHWHWRQPLFRGHALFDSASALWVLLTAAFFAFNSTARDFRLVGVMDGAAVARGEWWRIFTAQVLHADLMHFATNAVFGLLLLGLAMGRYGTGVGLLAAYLAGASGNVLSWLVHDQTHRALGASGVVMGALGLLAPSSITMLRGNPRALRLAFGGLAGGLMLFVLLGLGPGTDVAAHFGGFAAGILLGLGLTLVPRVAERPWGNWLAAVLLAGLVIWPWLLALQLRVAR